MKVRDAIDQLERYCDPDDDIIFAWWGKNMFEDVDPEKWPEFCDVVEDKLDWSRTHESMTWLGEDRVEDLYGPKTSEDSESVKD